MKVWCVYGALKKLETADETHFSAAACYRRVTYSPSGMIAQPSFSFLPPPPLGRVASQDRAGLLNPE